MEPLPSQTPFMSALERGAIEEALRALWLQPDDSTRRQYIDNPIWAGEILSTPDKDPPEPLVSLPTSLPSPSPSLTVSDLAFPPCLEFDPFGVAAASGGSIEAADARSDYQASDWKDCDYGGEHVPESRQQSEEVASRAAAADTGSQRLLQCLQRLLDNGEAIIQPDPAILIEYNAAIRASHESSLIFRNAFRSEPSPSRGNSTGAEYDACAKGSKRGHRSPNWRSEEKNAFLEVKVEAQTAVKGKDWVFISEALKDRYAYERSAKSCEDLWGTLLKSFKVIRHHESMNHSSSWCSYWELDEKGRSERQLPKNFPVEWFEMIESILAGKGKRAAGDQQWITTKDPGLKSLGSGAGEYSSLLRLADGVLNPQRDLPETSTSSILTMSKETIGSYLQSVVIDALQSALQPIVTILQCEDEEKQEFDAKMKALDKKRRALDLEEIQIKRQRVGQHQRTSSRSTYRHKQQAGLPAKKASVKEIIPAFKELNIATSGPGAH